MFPLSAPTAERLSRLESDGPATSAETSATMGLSARV